MLFVFDLCYVLGVEFTLMCGSLIVCLVIVLCDYLPLRCAFIHLLVGFGFGRCCCLFIVLLVCLLIVAFDWISLV